jgi:hypothetical protein
MGLVGPFLSEAFVFCAKPDVVDAIKHRRGRINWVPFFIDFVEFRNVNQM